MTTCYFKTNDPAILDAYLQAHHARAALQLQIDAFAARFGAEGGRQHPDGTFIGLKFADPPPRVYWRGRDVNGLNWLRTKPSRARAEDRQQHVALTREWLTHFPVSRVDDGPFYRALGYTSALDFVVGGLRVFVRGDWLDAATSRPMLAMTEILGSEYAAAMRTGASC